MRVEVHACDAGGCGHYRTIWPGYAVEASGAHEVEVCVPDSDNQPWLPTMVDQDGVIRALGHRETWPDVLVLQRPLRRLVADVIPFLQERGTAVVVEVDDDFSCIDRRNVAWRADGQERNAVLADACARADLVTVSTPRLAERYAPHGRVRVLPNYVPTWYLGVGPVGQAGREDGEVWVGWSGSVATHRGDLETTGRAVTRALAHDRRAVVRAVGTGVGVGRALSLGTKDVDGSGWVDLPRYPREVARLDVGVAPLEDTPFNRAKSWLKVLEYAALGVACVATRLDEYQRFEDVFGEGTVRLVETPRQWEGAVKALLRDDARAEQAQRARAALAGATIEAHRDDWSEAWTAAHTYHREGHP